MSSSDHIWDLRYVRLARLVAFWSKDPSTQCGAIIVRPNKTLASVGFNGFPRGMKDDPSRYGDRSIKYPHIIHSEWNAISACSDPNLEGYSVYAWPMPPCDECTAPLVQKKISKVVFPTPEEDKLDRWRDAFDDAMDMWKQSKASVVTLSLPEDEPFDELTFHNASKWDGRFLNMAREVASWSKAADQQGAVIVRPDRTVSSLGFNGYPQSVDDTPLINGTSKRRARLLSGVNNAILFSQDSSLDGCRIYLWPGPPSIRETVHLIQEGVRDIVSPEGDVDPQVLDALNEVGGSLTVLGISS